MNWTTRFRILYAALFTASVLTALVGWLLDMDPGLVDSVVMITAGACGIGEASNVGKRATWKRDAVEVEGD